MVAAALKVEAAFLSADDDGIAVQRLAFACRTEGTDIFNPEDAAVRPGNGPGLHITGGIKVGSDLNIDTVRHGVHLLFQNSEFRIQDYVFEIILNTEFLLN